MANRWGTTKQRSNEGKDQRVLSVQKYVPYSQSKARRIIDL